MHLRAKLESVAVTVLVAATLVACKASGPAPGLRIDPEFEAAFQALEAAVVEHEDELARTILDRIESHTRWQAGRDMPVIILLAGRVDHQVEAPIVGRIV